MHELMQWAPLALPARRRDGRDGSLRSHEASCLDRPPRARVANACVVIASLLIWGGTGPCLCATDSLFCGLGDRDAAFFVSRLLQQHGARYTPRGPCARALGGGGRHRPERPWAGGPASRALSRASHAPHVVSFALSFVSRCLDNH